MSPQPSRAALVAALALALALLLGGVWTLRARSELMDPAVGAAAEAEFVQLTSDRAGAVDVAEPLAVSASERRVGAPEARLDPVRQSGEGLPPLGWLVLRVVGALDGQSVPNPRVRAVSATRLADVSKSGTAEAIEVRLTPGTYALWIGAPGYEPVEIREVIVRPHERNLLDPIRLESGSAQITGHVVNARRGQDLRAELHGDGRRPCDECGPQPCPRCGYDSQRSLVPLDALGEFRFAGLASGRYALRILGADEHEAAGPVQVELSRAEARRVELRLDPVRTLEVALVDTDHTRLDAIWAAWHRPPIEGDDAELTFELRADSEMWACTLLAGASVLAQGEFISPRPPGDQPTNFGRFAISFGMDPRLGVGPEDVARQPTDELRPAASFPVPPPGRVAAGVLPSGLVRIEHVPVRAERLILRCGPFEARGDVGRSDDLLVLTLRRDAGDADGARAPTFLAWELGGPR